MHLEQSGFDGAPRFLGAEPDGSIVLSWIEGWVLTDAECWRLGLSELASVGELLRSYHDSIAGFAPETGFPEGPQAVASGQVVCHGDIAPRHTVFRDGQATAFIDWDGKGSSKRSTVSARPPSSSALSLPSQRPPLAQKRNSAPVVDDEVAADIGLTRSDSGVRLEKCVVE
ncbi:phosphotransferase [Candidatus Poriferisodalis sp.]|uniref:phosphotransferase n=1 Tax=Candidatus Poriferisodalis sp. TaxID=3101277 RepID=UPI003C703A59